MGDVGFQTNILLVPQLKTNLISEGKLALSGWETMAYNRVKEGYNQWNKLMEAVIQNEANPLYIANPIYVPSTEAANQTIPEGAAEGIAFAGMAHYEGQEEHKGEESDWPNEETQHWHHFHRRRVNRHAHPVHEIRPVESSTLKQTSLICV